MEYRDSAFIVHSTSFPTKYDKSRLSIDVIKRLRKRAILEIQETVESLKNLEIHLSRLEKKLKRSKR